MPKKMHNGLIVLGVSVGGLFLLGLTYLSYFAVTLAIEALIYSTNPQAVPMDLVRRGFALFIVLVYVLIDRLRWSSPIKATLMIAPLSMALITVVLQYYQNMILALSLCAVLVGILTFVFWKQKRAWIYFYAIAFSVVMALFYGWPR